MSAVLFGSISTLADTSELQRQAFNDAFRQHGLDWQWDQADYAELLTGNGGRDRIADFAAERGDTVDADAVHRTKSELFQQALASGVEPRAGVVETIADARSAGARIALVTTTSPDNVAALAAALGPEVGVDSFDLLVDSEKVHESKPSPAAYSFALEQLGEDAASCVAIEDNVGGVESATAAGVTCVAFPNENTKAHSFDAAAARVENLAYDELVAAGRPGRQA